MASAENISMTKICISMVIFFFVRYVSTTLLYMYPQIFTGTSTDKWCLGLLSRPHLQQLILSATIASCLGGEIDLGSMIKLLMMAGFTRVSPRLGSSPWLYNKCHL